MILVHQLIAIDDREYTPSGTLIVRYKGPRIDDSALVDFAASEGFRVLVLVVDGYLLAENLLQRAIQSQVTLVVMPESHPIRAAKRIREYADELAWTVEPVLRLLADGPEAL